MPPHELRRPFKRPLISDQQRRREQSLLRQSQNRHDAQFQARRLASTVLSLQSDLEEPESTFRDIEIELLPDISPEQAEPAYDIRQASKLRGLNARRWFARQLMLPEWMIDIPDNLRSDWYVLARPAGQRCFVVSSNGMTISRLRNGSLLHRFPSALPNGSRMNNVSRSAQSYCILDCIFHELDQTYYVIDMVCWAGISFYECTAEFRLFWLSNKLNEVGASESPSQFHRHRFSMVPVYNCDEEGLITAYREPMSYVKDGLLFYNKHAHYQTGNTPLALVWKDDKCSQYVIDTDSKGQVPDQQLVVLVLLDDGRLATSDDPPAILGSLNSEFLQKTDIQRGDLLRFSVSKDGLRFLDGKLEKADLNFVGKPNRVRAFADSYSKVVFQYMARHSPITIEDLFASIRSSGEGGPMIRDSEMVG